MEGKETALRILIWIFSTAGSIISCLAFIPPKTDFTMPPPPLSLPILQPRKCRLEGLGCGSNPEKMKNRPRRVGEGAPRTLREDGGVRRQGRLYLSPRRPLDIGSQCTQQAITWDAGLPVLLPPCLPVPGLLGLTTKHQSFSSEHGLGAETEIAGYRTGCRAEGRPSRHPPSKSF